MGLSFSRQAAREFQENARKLAEKEANRKWYEF
jgi:hypothetical protein